MKTIVGRCSGSYSKEPETAMTCVWGVFIHSFGDSGPLHRHSDSVAEMMQKFWMLCGGRSQLWDDVITWMAHGKTRPHKLAVSFSGLSTKPHLPLSILLLLTVLVLDFNLEPLSLF